MANPAELLFDQLSAWNDETKIVKDVRQDSADLLAHRQAVKYLEQIATILDLLEQDGIRVGVYRKYFPNWAQIIFNYPNTWGQTRAKISPVALDHLENLINHAEQVVLPIDHEKLQTLKLYLDAVELALKDDQTLSDPVKIRTLQVVTNVRHVIANINVVGDFEFHALIESLFATLASVEMKSQNKQRWNEWADRFVWPFAYDSFKFAAGYGFSQLQSSGAFEMFQRAISGS